MSIALAHYSSKNDISGVTTWFERFVLQLQRDGYTPVVHLHHYGKKPSDASVLPKLLDAGVTVESIERGPTLQDDVHKTLTFLNRYRPSLFLPQCLSSHFIAASIAGRQGLPWAFTIHSDDPDYWNNIHETTPCNSMGRVVCVSEHIASLVREKQVDPNPFVIPYGVDVKTFEKSLPDDKFRVAYIGRFVEHQKRMSLVIESLIQACQLHPAIRVVLIGDGPELKKCKRHVFKKGLGDRITFMGRISPHKVINLLKDIHACILMSDFEGLPVAILEAMSVGVVPVVRAIESGIPELVQDRQTGLIIDDKPSSAARALTQLAKDNFLWQRCSRQARELVMEKYSEEVCYQKWIGLVEKLRSENKDPFSLEIELPIKLMVKNQELLIRYVKKRPFGIRVVNHMKKLIYNY